MVFTAYLPSSAEISVNVVQSEAAITLEGPEVVVLGVNVGYHGILSRDGVPIANAPVLFQVFTLAGGALGEVVYSEVRVTTSTGYYNALVAMTEFADHLVRASYGDPQTGVSIIAEMTVHTEPPEVTTTMSIACQEGTETNATTLHIDGALHSATGAILAGVSVRIYVDGVLAQTVTTDAAGQYHAVIGPVSVGVYDIVAEFPGAVF